MNVRWYFVFVRMANMFRKNSQANIMMPSQLVLTLLPVIFKELKEKGLPWEKAKAWDNSAVVGKWIPIANIKNKKDINFCMYKNKELVQQGNSSLMIHSFDEIVAYISNYFSINIGDLIFTGTPAGVGEAVVGDELEGFIEDESLFTMEVK